MNMSRKNTDDRCVKHCSSPELILLYAYYTINKTMTIQYEHINATCDYETQLILLIFSDTNFPFKTTYLAAASHHCL